MNSNSFRELRALLPDDDRFLVALLALVGEGLVTRSDNRLHLAR